MQNELISLGAVFEQFMVSLSMLIELTSLCWAMINADALETGLLGNAFLFTDLDVEEMQGLAQTKDLCRKIGCGDLEPLLPSKLNASKPVCLAS